MIVYNLARDIPAFVMYCVNGESGYRLYDTARRFFIFSITSSRYRVATAKTQRLNGDSVAHVRIYNPPQLLLRSLDISMAHVQIVDAHVP